LAPITGPLVFYGQGIQQSLAAEEAAINGDGGIRGGAKNVFIPISTPGGQARPHG
jgi:ABC-type branched-subunit amino acid transport system substrate-binding protein